MNDLRKVAYELARNFRDKYNLGSYCANDLLEILDLMEKYEKINIELIRTPFKNLNLAGFIGYKYDTYIIVTNTNQTLGYERFTIAHEIYHILQNRVSLKNNFIIEEIVHPNEENKDPHEIMADSFAAELLVPENSLRENLERITEGSYNKIDYNTIIHLQHKYGVEYIAVTRRLEETGIIDRKKKDELDQILKIEGQLQELTKKLGRGNELNIPSRACFIMQRNLAIIKHNFEKGCTTYDDLVRIFGYLGTTPEEFGYEDSKELSQEAIKFMESLSE